MDGTARSRSAARTAFGAGRRVVRGTWRRGAGGYGKSIITVVWLDLRCEVEQAKTKVDELPIKDAKPEMLAQVGPRLC